MHLGMPMGKGGGTIQGCVDAAYCDQKLECDRMVGLDLGRRALTRDNVAICRWLGNASVLV